MRKFIGLVVVGAMGLTLIGATAASARTAAPSPNVVRTGRCTGPSTWKLTLKHDAGRIESDLEVQTPAAGQMWHYVMKDNGTRFAAGNKVTKPDGSFSVTRFAPNALGTDHIVARSNNLTTGEVCRATAAI